MLVGASMGRAQLTLSADLTLDSAALLMPSSAPYGRSINGVAFQSEPLITYNGYQYATWYHNGSDEDMYVARRAVASNTWQVVDTLKNFDNGDASPANGASTWDAHNVISMGVSGDGRMHFSWDMHGSPLRYLNTTASVATNPGAATWNSTIFNAERTALNAGGSAISNVTYPQFITKANGDMLMNYRTGTSGNGNVWISTYRASTGLWDAPHEIIRGTATGVTYIDPYGSNSSDRNAYINGMNIDGTGRIHTTWVWRETATGGSNHDMSYAYSDDGGDTWRNNAGGVVGTLGNPMKMDAQAANNASGLIVVPMNRGNTLMNQQGQTVDEVGGVHMLMWHKTDAAPAQTGFTTAPSAYYHYYRNPTTGAWSRIDLPTSRAVGSRADMAYDADGNLYVAYVSPGPGDGQGVLNYYTEGDLIVATASRAFGYQDWSIVSTDTRDWAGEPHIDQARLLQNGVLSVIMQENNDANVNRTGTPLHVLEYNKLAKNLVWAGDVAGVWNAGGEWDSDNNNVGDATFAVGNRVTFDDGAADFSVAVAAPVSPGATIFRNTPAQSYTLAGSPITGSGSLSMNGGGTVTLANGANSYTGETNITQGRLNLTGTGALTASAQINVAAGATLDATGTASGGLTLNAQTIAGAGQVIGNLAAQTGAVVRVGGAGMPTSQQQTTTVVDNFSDADLSQYTRTVVNDPTAAGPNVSFSSPSGTLSAAYAGTAAVEQVVFLRNDVSLGVGSTLIVDLAIPQTGQQLDFGLAVSATATPTPSSAGTLDTRATFDWASVSARPSQTAHRIAGAINGAIYSSAGVAGVVDPTSIAQLYITRNSATQFTVGYTDTSSVKHDGPVATFSAANVGTAIGFYADLRTVGSLGVLDNLRILNPLSTVYTAETLTINGDASISSGATLALDVFSPAIADKLAVSGNFAAGGALSVLLAAAAPAPALGASFDLLDFATASGGFDAFSLPVLASGLAWNVSDLLVDGMLNVVVDVDLDNDGLVDGDDFLLIQRTNVGLISAWQAQFGDRLVTPAGSLPVPEPAAATLVVVAVCLAGWAGRRRNAAVAAQVR